MNGKALYLSSPQLQEKLPLFFQPWWLDIVSSHWDMIIATEDNVPQAVFPICIEKKSGIKIIRNPLLTPYLGPYILNKSSVHTASKLFSDLWQQLPKWDSFDMETTVDFGDENLLKEKGFEVTQKDTYILDLIKEEALLFSGIHSNHRNLIRQASGLHSINSDLKHLPVLLSLHKATFDRKKKAYPFRQQQIGRLVDESVQRGHGQLFAAIDSEQQVTAAIFTVWDKQTMYLLLSTVNTTNAHAGAVRMLIWEAIKKAKALQLSFFDFEGSMDAGIAAFFRRFGGEKKTYICASKTTSLLWNLKKQFLG